MNTTAIARSNHHLGGQAMAGWMFRNESEQSITVASFSSVTLGYQGTSTLRRISDSGALPASQTACRPQPCLIALIRFGQFNVIGRVEADEIWFIKLQASAHISTRWLRDVDRDMAPD